MRARTPPTAETAALTCPRSRPQPAPRARAPASVTPKAGDQATSIVPPRGWRAPRSGRPGPESVVEAMADEAGADQAHRHRRRVQAGLRVGQGERHGQEGIDGAEQVDEVAEGRLVDVGAPDIGQPARAVDRHAPRTLERPTRGQIGRQGVNDGLIRWGHELDARPPMRSETRAGRPVPGVGGAAPAARANSTRLAACAPRQAAFAAEIVALCL